MEVDWTPREIESPPYFNNQHKSDKLLRTEGPDIGITGSRFGGNSYFNWSLYLNIRKRPIQGIQ